MNITFNYDKKTFLFISLMQRSVSFIYILKKCYFVHYQLRFERRKCNTS